MTMTLPNDPVEAAVSSVSSQHDSFQKNSLSHEGHQGTPSSNELKDSTQEANSGSSYLLPPPKRTKNEIKSPNRVIFAAPPQYDQWVWLLLSFPLVLIFFQIVFVVAFSGSSVDFQRSETAWALGWTVIMILVLYMMVLPKQLDVRANGTIGIKTFLVTYQFGSISRAYTSEAGGEDIWRPRYRFATTLKPSHRVIVRRQGRLVDLILSPQKPQEFLQALESVIKPTGDLEAGPHQPNNSS